MIEIPTTLAGAFPNGWVHYLAGGVLIGLAVAAIYVGSGLITGASTFLESTLSYVSGAARFQRYRASRDWRALFTLGIVGGALGYSLATGGFGWTTAVDPWRLFAGGILVGIGTRVGKGCTSGHGICGVGSLSGTSIVNVAAFILLAIVTAHLVEAAGVVP